VLRQLPSWLAHYNEIHPHRALGYRSPREFIARSTPEALTGQLGGYLTESSHVLNKLGHRAAASTDFNASSARTIR
jgi:hypothetical protein